MTTIIVSILIASPIAFLAGWLLAKVLLVHERGDEAQAAREQREAARRGVGADRASTLTGRAARPGAVSAGTAASPRKSAPELSMNESQALNAALAERDQTIERLRLRAEQHGMAGDPNALAELKREVDALHAQLRKSLARERKLRGHLNERRRRGQALVGRLKEQRQLIGELRAQATEAAQSAKAASARHQPDLLDQLEERLSEPLAADQREGHAYDDLQRIRGIGPVLNGRLRKLGIVRYQQLAAMSPEELAALSNSLGIGSDRLQRLGIAEQATRLLRESSAHLS